MLPPHCQTCGESKRNRGEFKTSPREVFIARKGGPYPERKFQIFSAPNFHFLVVAAQLEEIRLVHREQTSRHRRGPERPCDVPAPVRRVGRRARVPPEMQIPIEGSPVQLETSDVGESLVADYVDHGAHHALSVPGHPADKTREPSCAKNQKRKNVQSGTTKPKLDKSIFVPAVHSQ